MTGTAALAPSPGVPRAAASTGAGLWVSSLVVAGRMVRKFARTPQLIVFTTIQSALFLLMFRFAFGGAIGTGGSVSYVNFLVPGFIATTCLWTGMGAATGVAEDVEHGFVDRLRTEPLREIDEWLAPYRAAWAGRLGALEAHHDDMDAS